MRYLCKRLLLSGDKQKIWTGAYKPNSNGYVYASDNSAFSFTSLVFGEQGSKFQPLRYAY